MFEVLFSNFISCHSVCFLLPKGAETKPISLVAEFLLKYGLYAVLIEKVHHSFKKGTKSLRSEVT